MGIVISILLAVVSLIISAIMFLISRFDILNSLLTGLLVFMLTCKNEWSNGTNWLIFLIVVAIAMLLQHRFKIMRIVFGVFSSLIVAFLGYEWMAYDSIRTQYLVTAICFTVAGLLNISSWGIIMDRKMSIS